MQVQPLINITHDNYGKINSILEILYRPPNVWPRIDTSSNYRLVINSVNNDLVSLALYSDQSVVMDRKIRIKKIKILFLIGPKKREAYNIKFLLLKNLVT